MASTCSCEGQLSLELKKMSLPIDFQGHCKVRSLHDLEESLQTGAGCVRVWSWDFAVTAGEATALSSVYADAEVSDTGRIDNDECHWGECFQRQQESF